MLARLFDPLRHARRAWRDRRALPHPRWRERCIARKVALDEVSVDARGELRLERAGITLPDTALALDLLEAHAVICELAQLPGVQLTWNTQLECLLVEHEAVRYPTRCAEELWILRELLHEGDYDLLSPGPTLLIDVGANVGFTCLYFAAASADTQVVGFEPLTSTCDIARANVAYNAALAERIELRNVALARDDETRTLHAIPGHRGRSSLVGPPTSPRPGLESEQHEVRCEQASRTLTALRAAHPLRRVVMKLDCEGSEFDILDELHAAGVLCDVEAFVLEWHDIDGARARLLPLRTLLASRGYHVYVRGRHGVEPAGMLYAVAAKAS